MPTVFDEFLVRHALSQCSHRIRTFVAARGAPRVKKSHVARTRCWFVWSVRGRFEFGPGLKLSSDSESGLLANWVSRMREAQLANNPTYQTNGHGRISEATNDARAPHFAAYQKHRTARGLARQPRSSSRRVNANPEHHPAERAARPVSGRVNTNPRAQSRATRSVARVRACEREPLSSIPRNARRGACQSV